MLIQESEFFGKSIEAIFGCNFEDKNKLHENYTQLLIKSLLVEEKTLIEQLYKIAQYEEPSKHYNINPQSNFSSAYTMVYENINSRQTMFRFERTSKAKRNKSLINILTNDRFQKMKEAKKILQTTSSNLANSNDFIERIPITNKCPENIETLNEHKKLPSKDDFENVFTNFGWTQQEIFNRFLKYLYKVAANTTLDISSLSKLNEAINKLISPPEATLVDNEIFLINSKEKENAQAKSHEVIQESSALQNNSDENSKTQNELFKESKFEDDFDFNTQEIEKYKAKLMKAKGSLRKLKKKLKKFRKDKREFKKRAVEKQKAKFYKIKQVVTQDSDQLDENEVNNKNVRHKQRITKNKRVCETCGKEFASASTLSRHKILHKDNLPHSCKCSKKFSRRDELMAHINRQKSKMHKPVNGN